MVLEKTLKNFVVPAKAQKEGELLRKLLISYTQELRDYSSKTIAAQQRYRFINRDNRKDMWKEACLKALTQIQEK